MAKGSKQELAKLLFEKISLDVIPINSGYVIVTSAEELMVKNTK